MKTVNPAIDLKLARRVLEVVDAGLINGLGTPKPGQMCVEAAVNYAMGSPHGDSPTCVHPNVRYFKITLNDKDWSSKSARAVGLRRIAVAQLGSEGIDGKKFLQVLQEQTIRKILPVALRAAAKLAKAPHKENLEKAAVGCEINGTKEAALTSKKVAAAAYTAYAAAYTAAAAAYAYTAAAAAYADAAYADAVAAACAAYTAAAAACAAKSKARDEIYTLAAECGIEALRQCGSPGVAFMDQLCPL